MTKRKNHNFILLLRKKGFTQTELADALKISIPSVNAWVNNRAKPSIENIAKMSIILDIDLDELDAVFFDEESNNNE